jgi:Zn-dependent M28 family amino/carboxypeptidase
MGRKPFTEGEEKTVAYLQRELSAMGLEPGNGESFYQEVPLVEIDAVPDTTMVVQSGDQQRTLRYRKDYVALTRRITDQVDIKGSELVFCGFGVVAPEYGWNDYADVDMTGKTAVVLVNDPGFGTDDSTLFKGNAMTYYGRWTYKYEEAARQGAEGVLIVHNTAPAGYPWGVVQSSWTGKALYLQSEDDNRSRCALEGWLSQGAARDLFAMANVENYLGKARQAGFRPIPMGTTIDLSMQVRTEKATSRNVIALRRGSQRPDEYVIYSAHWDHLGVGAPIAGDSIYNGALDNATGTAVLLEIARAFSELEAPPARSVAFLFVTAEEQGLLGSAYYAENPIYPLKNTVANINLDGIWFRGPMSDLTVVGYGQSELDDYAREAADAQGRYIKPDPNAEKGYFFRSDHFSFAKVGVPALYASGEHEQTERGVAWTKAQSDAWIRDNYHQPSDEYLPGEWQLGGMVQDAELLFAVGHRLSTEATFPAWKDGSEFKATREASRL